MALHRWSWAAELQTCPPTEALGRREAKWLTRLVSAAVVGVIVVVFALSQAGAQFWLRAPGDGARSQSYQSGTDHAAPLGGSFAALTDSLARNTENLAATPSIRPTAGWLSSPFSGNRRHPIVGGARPHNGVDLSSTLGAPIVAPAAGKVTRVSRDRGYGLVLEIDHGLGVVTRYAHCSKTMVREGQHVTRGQAIAAVGNSGLSTGPHLHYEIRVHGRPVNPLSYSP